jgi:hypothetical protein
MKNASIKLKGKTYKLKPPTPYAAELLRQWSDDPIGPVVAAIAVVMTDSEPKDFAYRPRKVWYPGEVALLLPLDPAEREKIASVVYDLLKEAGIIGGGGTKETDDEVDPPIPGEDTLSQPADTSEPSA